MSSDLPPDILELTEDYVKEIFRREIPVHRFFHNIQHTMNVVDNVRTLGKYYGLPAHDMILLQIAAWFHDTGYVSGSEQHEATGVRIAMEFLRDLLLSVPELQRVDSIIMATKSPTRPQDIYERIICDADLQHLGSVEYFQWSLLLKREAEAFTGKIISEQEWIMENINFFNRHPYHTDAAAELWGSQRQQNYLILMAQII